MHIFNADYNPKHMVGIVMFLQSWYNYVGW